MRKRLIFRGDDVGYTKTYNDGIFKGIDEGIITDAEYMLDSPGTIDALQRLKERPWISVGWHRHLWNYPVLPKEEVPSLVDEEGRFKWRHKQPGRMVEATYEDCYKEFMAEAELSYQILGRYPDTATIRNSDLPLEKAFADVVKELHIVHNIETFRPGSFKAEHQKGEPIPCSMKLFNGQIIDETYNNWHDKCDFDLKTYSEYKPEEYTFRHHWESEDEIIYGGGGHPGYLDDFILSESRSNIYRVRELQACLSKEVRQWIIDNQIELINVRDALYGTNEYQMHLKNIGSDLYMLEK